MASLLRESEWHGLRAGDVFRIPGIRGRRFRFVAHITNFDNGATHVEAVDVEDGSYRAFRPDLKMVKARASSGSG